MTNFHTTSLLSKCRFCLRDEEHVGVLKSIEPETFRLFCEVTQTFPVINSNIFSMLCCCSCAGNFVMYSNFKNQMIENQMILYQNFTIEQEQKQAENEVEAPKTTENQKGFLKFVSSHEVPKNVCIVTNLKLKTMKKADGQFAIAPKPAPEPQNNFKAQQEEHNLRLQEVSPGTKFDLTFIARLLQKKSQSKAKKPKLSNATSSQEQTRFTKENR